MPSPILEHLSALGDETRTRLLSLLERSEFTVSELCASLQVPQPTVSRHLKTLADGGWVTSRADGRNRHYRLAETLDGPSRDLWRIVRTGLADDPVYARDHERGRAVLAERRRRAAVFFADTAGRWDELRQELYGARADALPLFALLDPRWDVADLGAGTGALSGLFAPFVRSVIAVDRSDEMLDAARRRLEGVANAHVRRGELEDLPIEDATLDLAVLSLVLHYVVDPRDVLAEAFRVLKPAGRLLLVELREHERGTEYAEGMGHVWPGFAPDRMGRWLRDAGFQDVFVHTIPPDPDASGPLLFLASGSRPPGDGSPESDIHHHPVRENRR
ncbi:MAG TPA: metalloregulator ArsR/SmtB family transcription factor [Longimicrobiales bacterium]|nr:metalloregulator ArsR/SmtB family transcription factor [Longimicrobiales bacterium]